LNARIQYAKFLQDTVGEMAKELKTSKRSDLRRTADDLDGFMQKVRTGGKVQNDDILAFAKLFNDELTLDNISRCTCAPPSVLGQGVLRAIRSHHNCSFPTLGGSINLSQF
jgi:hypothetical protein